MSYLQKLSFISAGVLYTMPAFSALDDVETGATIPHMDVSTFASQLFWLAVSFGVLYFIMSRKALPQIHDILERRHNTVQNNLEKAAKLRDEAEDVQIAYDKALRQAENHAQEFLNNSIDDMTNKNAETLSQAMEKTIETIKTAETKIAQLKQDAIKDAEKIADDIATLLTEKVIDMQNLNTKATKKRA